MTQCCMICIQSEVFHVRKLMDLLKALLYRHSLSTIFLACMFCYCVAKHENLGEVSSKCEKDVVFTTATGNRCYYDRDCFKIFQDCCPNYEKVCGRQEPTEPKSVSRWKCVELGRSLLRLPCKIYGVTGIWMIHKCPANWTLLPLRTRCENLPPELSYPIEDFIPVVGSNNRTYRNKHCALCNGVENYTSWNIDAVTVVLPPEEFDVNSRLQFVEKNGGEIRKVLPDTNQPLRLCYGRNYINNCSLTGDPLAYKDCINGPVELVRKKDQYFKNHACAKCNGYPGVYKWWHDGVCGPAVPPGFSIVFSLRNTGELTTTVDIINCPNGTVYDTSLKFCREGYIIFPSSKLSTEFLILLWFKQLRGEMNETLQNILKATLTFRLCLQANQISKIVFHNQWYGLIVATFRLTLTPFQNLIVMANQRHSNLSITNNNTAFLKLLKFTGNFTLAWRQYTFSVVKVISQQLSCYGQVKFQSNEYKLDKENKKLFDTKTGKIFLLDNYTLVKREGGNILLCRKLVLSDCTNGAYVPLHPDEYVIFPNLTVYQNATESIFNFGDYLIDERLVKVKSHSSKIARNTISPRNSIISVCLPFKDTLNKVVTRNRRTTSYGLRVLTLIGFIISITCLILLLITYGLFQELRTLPGMNLMNFSFSMLLSHFFWLVSANFTGTTACKVFAILGHYLCLVSFLAMSVISYHSFRTFSQLLSRRNAEKTWKKFRKYSVFVWLPPAFYIAVCVTLDETEAFLVDYGRYCWLGTTNAKLYLFLLPIALILLYNICTFIKTAVNLSRHEKQRKTLQIQKKKRNLYICTKLATLVGFPWLFSFVGVLFPDVEAFEYLFVVFVCLQGLYIGMAFLFNKRTLKLYKDRLNIGYNRTAQTDEMT